MSNETRKQFDVFQRDNKIAIVTTNYNHESENVEVENFISIQRAKEILEMLKNAIYEADKDAHWANVNRISMFEER